VSTAAHAPAQPLLPPSLALTGRVALVTGASRGIGRAIARALAQRGAAVAVNFAAREDAAQALCDEIASEGGVARPIGFDVADAAAVEAGVQRVVTELGGLHVLVNNAGISIDALIMRFKDEDWKKTLDVNLTGAFYLTRAATRPMMKQRTGAIVNIASVVGEMGNAGQVAYSASKGGLIALTKTTARELASRNIRVNAVAPGYIDTPMTQALPEAAKQKMAEMIPLARLGTAQDVADCVAWLASDKASYLTGEVVRVNGGMYM
jgi:3-oxoacyl-[acyl-carrier protein] reductase